MSNSGIQGAAAAEVVDVRTDIGETVSNVLSHMRASGKGVWTHERSELWAQPLLHLGEEVETEGEAGQGAGEGEGGF